MVPHSICINGHTAHVLALNFSSRKIVVQQTDSDSIYGYSLRGNVWELFAVTRDWFDPVQDAARFGGPWLGDVHGAITIGVRS